MPAGLTPGQRAFLHYLEHDGNRSMQGISVDEFLGLYCDKEKNRAEITNRLSHVTVGVAEGFLSVYTSKDEQRRATILEIRRKGNVEKLRVVGSSAARNARAHAASLWTEADLTNKWCPWLDDPTRGTGCPFYHKRITNALLAKTREDIKAGRGPTSAKQIVIEDHTEFQRKVCSYRITCSYLYSYSVCTFSVQYRCVSQILNRELLAGRTLTEDLKMAAAAEASEVEDKHREAYVKWASTLTVAEVSRMAVTMQRESGGRAEISNLRKRELKVEFNGVTERPGITKARRDGNTEPCIIKHTAQGPFCYRTYVDLAEDSVEGPPLLSTLLERTEKFLALKKKDQGICCACAYVMFDRVMNCRWHAQQCSAVPAQHWPLTSRFKSESGSTADAFVLPDLVSPNSKKEKLTVDSADVIPVFWPSRVEDSKPSEVQTKYVRVYIEFAWPDGVRVTMFGNEPYDLFDFKSHSVKQGTGFDLGVSSAPPSLIKAHLHHLNLPTTGFYQQWPLKETEMACALLSQPRHQTTDVVLTNAEILRHLAALKECHQKWEAELESKQAQDRKEHLEKVELLEMRMAASERRMAAMAGSVAQLVTTVTQALNSGYDGNSTNSTVVQMLHLNGQIQQSLSQGAQAPEPTSHAAPPAPPPAPPPQSFLPHGVLPPGMPPPAPLTATAIPMPPPAPPPAPPPPHQGMFPPAMAAAPPPAPPVNIEWASQWVLEEATPQSAPVGTLLTWEHDGPPRVLRYRLLGQSGDDLVVQGTWDGAQRMSMSASKFKVAKSASWRDERSMDERSGAANASISISANASISGRKRLASTALATAEGDDGDDFRPPPPHLVCGEGGCIMAFTDKGSYLNHRRRAINAVTPFNNDKQTAVHRKSDWMFFIDMSSKTPYCARGKDAVQGAPDQGCRRPFGEGPGYCNAAKQLARCKVATNCQCGSIAFPTEMTKQPRAMCKCHVAEQA